MSIRSFVPASAITLSLLGSAATGHAYEVWMGMHGTPGQASVDLSSWARTAAAIGGINPARTAVIANDGTATVTPAEAAGYRGANDAQFAAIIEAIAHNDHTFTEFPRDDIGLATAPGAELPRRVQDELDRRFERAAAEGYTLTTLLLHGSSNGNEWTLDDIQVVRDELDAREAADPTMPHVELGYLARAHSVAAQRILLSENIDSVTYEISANLWNTAGASRLANLQWFWNNPDLPADATKKLGSKKVIFQIFAETSTVYGTPTDEYETTRLLVRQLGQQMGLGFLRSSRVILSPTSRGVPAFQFYPDTTAPSGAFPRGAYVNSKTGIALSLHEQKSRFYSGATEARCRSKALLVRP